MLEFWINLDKNVFSEDSFCVVQGRQGLPLAEVLKYLFSVPHIHFRLLFSFIGTGPFCLGRWMPTWLLHVFEEFDINHLNFLID